MPDILWIIKNKILFKEKYTFRDELEVLRAMKTMHGDIFIDIGCNIGIYSRLMRKRFKRVYSIDPNPKYHAEIQVAISNKLGQAMFFIGNNIGGADSLIHNPHVQGREWKNDSPIQVETMTFDQLMLDADLVKIDVEGSEFEVIEGMNIHLPKQVIIELHDERRENELLAKMAEKGYIHTKLDIHHFLFKLRYQEAN